MFFRRVGSHLVRPTFVQLVSLEEVLGTVITIEDGDKLVVVLHA
jgi:hypothetical protein